MKEKDYAHLVGVPYELLDCWGLVKEFYKIIYKYELKTYYEVPTSSVEEREKIIKEKEKEFKKICLTKIVFGDMITFKVHGVESHVGVYLGKGKYLHSREGRDSCIENLTAKNGLHAMGAYRVEGLSL